MKGRQIHPSAFILLVYDALHHKHNITHCVMDVKGVWETAGAI